MKIRIALATFFAAALFAAVPATYAAVPNMNPSVHAFFFNGEKKIKFNVNNQTGVPIELKVGDKLTTLKPGEIMGFKLPVGTRITQQYSNRTSACGRRDRRSHQRHVQRLDHHDQQVACPVTAFDLFRKSRRPLHSEWPSCCLSSAIYFTVAVDTPSHFVPAVFTAKTPKRWLPAATLIDLLLVSVISSLRLSTPPCVQVSTCAFRSAATAVLILQELTVLTTES